VRANGCSIVSPDGQGMQHFLSVAPRCRLKDVSAVLATNNLTIPHGECPLVGIGGHVQTGGYGHQMRGLGLCLDYVYSFGIVVCTDAPVAARLVTVYRPELMLPDDQAPGRDHDLNDSLYKGVLGGSPGAFGVITQIKFLAVHDEDPTYRNSHNVMKVYPYQGKNVQEGAAQVVRTMLRLASLRTLSDGIDVFVTIVSKEIAFGFEWGVFVPEVAYTGSDFTRDVETQMNEILEACQTRNINWASWFIAGEKELESRFPSVVAHAGVRTYNNGVTLLGREFDFPYKKRVNVMLDTDKLSEDDAGEFAREFGRLAADVVQHRLLRLVIQMNVGGGKAATNDTASTTGIPYRNQSFGFVFDVFYTHQVAETEATRIQNDMQRLLNRIGGGCFNRRLFWGSFGRETGETDMSFAEVQELYYGPPILGAYSAMQDIKERVDPIGVFTTEFSVQNPARAR
jgi:hypothetical protein